MKHVKMTLAITAIVAAAALTTVAFTVPQQVMAWGHHHHHNNNNAIKVDQQINQLNACTNALCANDANNTADIHR
jgi:translation initiation factor 6 (eIF-6)